MLKKLEIKTFDFVINTPLKPIKVSHTLTDGIGSCIMQSQASVTV